MRQKNEKEGCEVGEGIGEERHNDNNTHTHKLESEGEIK